MSDGIPRLYRRYEAEESSAIERTSPGAPTYERTLIGVPVIPRPPAPPLDCEAVVVDVEDLQIADLQIARGG